MSKKAPTLSDKISPSLFYTPKGAINTWLDVKGCNKCGHQKCIAYSHIQTTKDFVAFSNNKHFSIDSYINCSTKNVVYLAACLHCHLQYVGCTSNTLKIRIRRHLSDIRNLNAVNVSGISRHFKTMQGGNHRFFLLWH